MSLGAVGLLLPFAPSLFSFLRAGLGPEFPGTILIFYMEEETSTCPARLNVLSASVQKEETKFSPSGFITFSNLKMEVVVKLNRFHGKHLFYYLVFSPLSWR